MDSGQRCWSWRSLPPVRRRATRSCPRSWATRCARWSISFRRTAAIRCATSSTSCPRCRSKPPPLPDLPLPDLPLPTPVPTAAPTAVAAWPNPPSLGAARPAATAAAPAPSAAPTAQRPRPRPPSRRVAHRSTPAPAARPARQRPRVTAAPGPGRGSWRSTASTGAAATASPVRHSAPGRPGLAVVRRRRGGRRRRDPARRPARAPVGAGGHCPDRRRARGQRVLGDPPPPRGRGAARRAARRHRPAPGCVAAGHARGPRRRRGDGRLPVPRTAPPPAATSTTCSGSADERICVLLGDVSGHGRESVTQAALARYTLRTLLAAGHPPAEALSRADTLLDPRSGGLNFVTVIAGIYDPATGELTYAKAGRRAADRGSGPSTTRPPRSPVPPIGIGVGETSQEYRVQLGRGRVGEPCSPTGLQDALVGDARVGRDEVVRLLGRRRRPRRRAAPLATSKGFADRVSATTPPRWCSAAHSGRQATAGPGSIGAWTCNDDGWAIRSLPPGRRDLGSPDLWERSLARSIRRREAAAARRTSVYRKKQALISAALMDGDRARARQRRGASSGDRGAPAPRPVSSCGMGSSLVRPWPSGRSACSASPPTACSAARRGAVARSSPPTGSRSTGWWADHRGALGRRRRRAGAAEHKLPPRPPRGPARARHQRRRVFGARPGGRSRRSSPRTGSRSTASSARSRSAHSGYRGVAPVAGGGGGGGRDRRRAHEAGSPMRSAASGRTRSMLRSDPVGVAQVGVPLPRTSFEQAGGGVHVDRAAVQAGDLVFFDANGPGASHVGIATSTAPRSPPPATASASTPRSITTGARTTTARAASADARASAPSAPAAPRAGRRRTRASPRAGDRPAVGPSASAPSAIACSQRRSISPRCA